MYQSFETYRITNLVFIFINGYILDSCNKFLHTLNIAPKTFDASIHGQAKAFLFQVPKSARLLILHALPYSILCHTLIKSQQRYNLHDVTVKYQDLYPANEHIQKYVHCKKYFPLLIILVMISKYLQKKGKISFFFLNSIKKKPNIQI